MDAEGTSDVFIKAYIDSDDKYETDTHYRCTTGAASFNYRLLMKTRCPRDDHVLHIQIWDRDILKSNDMICSYSIDLKYLFKDVHDTKKPIQLSKAYYDNYLKAKYKKVGHETELHFEQDIDTFWLKTKPKKDENGKSQKPIQIRLRIDLCPP